MISAGRAPRARPWHLGLALAGLCLALSARAAESTESPAAAQLLEAARVRLPVAWANALPADLTVEARDDLPAHVGGRTWGTRVRLDRTLVDAWADAPADPPHDARARLALATLIHELAHVLDRGPRGGLSRDARLRDLAGWPRRRLLPGRGPNDLRDRSPDAYEYTSAREFLAVNLEHYVLDPEYACRRPQLAAWFQARLGPAPLPRAPCAQALPLLQGQGTDGELGWLALDPARVYAIDYLHAEGNDAPMSRWGHTMLRLVICAPGRAPGPQCRLDLAWHRVLSFRAFVDDVQISSWRGLTGGYPSRLFVLPLEQVIDDYTQVELRGLASIPLALDRAGIDAVLARAAQLHWSHDGRYAFLGNNCAVETWKLLRDADPRIGAQAHWRGITPQGLLAALTRAGLADGAMLADRTAAERQGYYFASAQARYEAMFQVARAGMALPAHSAREWLDLPPTVRTPWIARADLRATAALLLLEQAAQRRQELWARDWLKRRLGQRDGEATHAREQVRQLLADAGVLAQPAALLAGVPGYGLPQAAEREALMQRLAERNARLKAGWPALRLQARQALPARQREDGQVIDQNLARIQAQLRRLAGE
ncbi:DUF4105 domain-containing protein [Stenotrophomonas sp. HITSZ_GD]|uniref:DUF7844 domain-containing protein n=1 Tax=Stenotrophomonas sp. HITSZ_GD TaxID=3037248 RepID=UPI00240D535C|nr:DUF4105 domain-containing protein [Stenotrophomonas sp. HITSZ_GD]MDG2526646.1 DUF4105 domain-containing protein [Stenotrophomonas sp. HITSZ_GD]